MIIVLEVVLIATGFGVGVLVGIEATNAVTRRRRRRYGRRRREMTEAFDDIAAQRAELADERWDLERRRRMLDG